MQGSKYAYLTFNIFFYLPSNMLEWIKVRSLLSTFFISYYLNFAELCLQPYNATFW